MLVLQTLEGVEIQQLAPGSRFTLPNGAIVSPAYPGWSNAYWEIVEVPDPVPEPEPEPLTNQDVNRERDRRVLLGGTFTPTGYASAISIAGDDLSRENLTNLGLLAQAMMAVGSTDLIPFRDDNNQIHQLTAAQMFELWQLGVTRISATYAASWAMKDNPDGIPADYTSDIYWP